MSYQRTFNCIRIFFFLFLYFEPILSNYNLTADNYPEFSTAVPFLKGYEQHFNKGLESLLNIKKRSLLDSDTDKYTRLCNNVVEIITPRQMKNLNGDFVQIVNYPETNYEQNIRVETCGDEEVHSCGSAELFPKNAKTICKQNYISRSLVTYAKNSDPASPKIELQELPIPASCECVILKD